MSAKPTPFFAPFLIGLAVIGLLSLGGCALPHPAATPQVYDFGPAAPQTRAHDKPGTATALAMGQPRASAALAGVAMLYRLDYADARQLKPYALAQWSMPPAQLIDQRLRTALAAQRAVVASGDVVVPDPAHAAKTIAPPQLQLELEEFSQSFETPTRSSGLLRLRATLTQRGSSGDTLLGQRSFAVQQPAPTPDASGGVQALAAATDVAVADLQSWLNRFMPIMPAQSATPNPTPQ